MTPKALSSSKSFYGWTYDPRHYKRKGNKLTKTYESTK